MAHTRQLRIHNPERIRQTILNSVGKMIHIVMNDSRPMVGTIAEVKPDGVVLANMRLKQSKIAFSEISEIYLDKLD